MYEVDIIDVDTNNTLCINEIDTSTNNRIDGNIKEGINCINSFQFTIYPHNRGFGFLKEFKSRVNILNTLTNKIDFRGRILSITPSMDNDGAFSSKVVCESAHAYLKDSDQDYKEKRDTGNNIFRTIINNHNSQVESYKQFVIGVCEFPDIINFTFEDDSSWENIQNLIEILDAEIVVRYENDANYIDLLQKDETAGNNSVELTVNMESASYEKDVSNIITKLKVLGAKIKDDKGKTTDRRVDISSKQGSKYIIDSEAMEAYGTLVGKVVFDDITNVDELISKGRSWLANNNKVIKKVKVNCLDLSVIGLSEESFKVRKKYQIVNKFINLDDQYRLISKTTSISTPHDVTLEFGEKQVDIKSEQISMSKTISKLNKEADSNVDNIGNVEIDVKELNDSVIIINDTLKDLDKSYVVKEGALKIVGNVEKEADLENITDAKLGDIYIIQENNKKFIYSGAAFVIVSEFFDFYEKEEIDEMMEGGN